MCAVPWPHIVDISPLTPRPYLQRGVLYITGIMLHQLSMSFWGEWARLSYTQTKYPDTQTSFYTASVVFHVYVCVSICTRWDSLPYIPLSRRTKTFFIPFLSASQVEVPPSSRPAVCLFLFLLLPSASSCQNIVSFTQHTATNASPIIHCIHVTTSHNSVGFFFPSCIKPNSTDLIAKLPQKKQTLHRMK